MCRQVFKLHIIQFFSYNIALVYSHRKQAKRAITGLHCAKNIYEFVLFLPYRFCLQLKTDITYIFEYEEKKTFSFFSYVLYSCSFIKRLLYCFVIELWKFIFKLWKGKDIFIYNFWELKTSGVVFYLKIFAVVVIYYLRKFSIVIICKDKNMENPEKIIQTILYINTHIQYTIYMSEIFIYNIHVIHSECYNMIYIGLRAELEKFPEELMSKVNWTDFFKKSVMLDQPF